MSSKGTIGMEWRMNAIHVAFLDLIQSLDFTVMGTTIQDGKQPFQGHRASLWHGTRTKTT